MQRLIMRNKSTTAAAVVVCNLLTRVEEVAAFNQQAQVVSRAVDLIVRRLNTRQSGRNEWSVDSNIEPFQPSSPRPYALVQYTSLSLSLVSCRSDQRWVNAT